MKKITRGTFEYTCIESVLIINGNNDAALSVATNKIKSSSCVMAETWSSAQKKKITSQYAFENT